MCGGTIMGISRALKEEVTFRGRSITSSDWRRYPVLRFTEAPDSVEIVTLDNDHPPLGAGEPPNVTPAAASPSSRNASKPPSRDEGVGARCQPLRNA